MTSTCRILSLALVALATASCGRNAGNTAVATGTAGVATAGSLIGSAILGLANGKPDEIGPAGEARAGEVEAQASRTCVGLAALHVTQETVATPLDAFRPYATIDARQAAQCTGYDCWPNTG